MKKLAIVLITVVLAACASPKPPEPIAEPQPAPIAEAPKPIEQPFIPPAPVPVAPAPITVPAPVPEPVPVAAPAPIAAPAPVPVPPMAIDPLDDPSSILARRSVFYPFDVSVVQPADISLVEAHAQYLSAHTNRTVRVEGNCDERGSSEYNLALGQRRADGVKKLLVAGGASGSQVETVSYGEDKPRATGHAEDSWRQNRRSDLNYIR